jgi:hypothetical protein
MLKSRRMRLALLVARMGAKRNAYRILVGKLEKKRLLGKDAGGWIILKWFLEREDEVVWTRVI